MPSRSSCLTWLDRNRKALLEYWGIVLSEQRSFYREISPPVETLSKNYSTYRPFRCGRFSPIFLIRLIHG